MNIITVFAILSLTGHSYSADKNVKKPTKLWTTDDCDAFADIVLIIDSSNNSALDNKNYNKILSFSADLSDTFKLGSDFSQIATVVYSNETRKEIDFNQITDHNQLRKAILQMTSLEASELAKPYHGLDLIENMFSIDLGGRYNAGKIAVLIMGKVSDIPEYTQNSAKRLQDQGVAVLVVAIGELLKNEPVVLGSNKKDVFLVDSLDDLWKVKDQITSRICEVTFCRAASHFANVKVDAMENRYDCKETSTRIG